MRLKVKVLFAILMCIVSCTPIEQGPTTPQKPEDKVPETETDILKDFPVDFSMVGYKYGAEPLPDYPVVVTLTPPADGSDATALIQNAIDKMTTKGAILLKAGTYNVSGKLTLAKDNVVLRGEGESTVIKATGTVQRTLLTLGKSTSRKDGASSSILDDYIPVGQEWVTVSSPSTFHVGNRVNVKATMNSKWVTDLKMDKIAQNSTNTVAQWKASEYVFRWERTVVKIEGNKVWLDIPLVMELDRKYLAEVKLQHVSWDRITESGIENLMLDTQYDVSNKEDEAHAWTAIDVKASEHCWIKDVKSAHFGYCTVEMKQGCRNITVRNCVCTEPISKIEGSRRYAFHINGGQLCLVEKCVADKDRHGFVFGARNAGPNVFVDCKMTNSYSEIGPHHRWSTGALYDNCTTDGQLAVYDRAGYGTGHGWTGVSFVFWNCTAAKIACQNPWVSGKNWCIGCIGTKVAGRTYSDGLVRPSGEWISHGVPVTPESLYRYQHSKRYGSALSL